MGEVILPGLRLLRGLVLSQKECAGHVRQRRLHGSLQGRSHANASTDVCTDAGTDQRPNSSTDFCADVCTDACTNAGTDGRTRISATLVPLAAPVSNFAIGSHN